MIYNNKIKLKSNVIIYLLLIFTIMILFSILPFFGFYDLFKNIRILYFIVITALSFLFNFSILFFTFNHLSVKNDEIIFKNIFGKMCKRKIVNLINIYETQANYHFVFKKEKKVTFLVFNRKDVFRLLEIIHLVADMKRKINKSDEYVFVKRFFIKEEKY